MIERKAKCLIWQFGGQIDQLWCDLLSFPRCISCTKRADEHEHELVEWISYTDQIHLFWDVPVQCDILWLFDWYSTDVLLNHIVANTKPSFNEIYYIQFYICTVYDLITKVKSLLNFCIPRGSSKYIVLSSSYRHVRNYNPWQCLVNNIY